MLYNPRQDQVSRDILAAAEVLKRDGWCQHRLWGAGTSVCASGALIVAICGHRDAKVVAFDDNGIGCQRLYYAQKYLEKHLGIHNQDSGYSTIPMWNDEKYRTKEEVIRLMCESVGVTEEVLV